MSKASNQECGGHRQGSRNILAHSSQATKKDAGEYIFSIGLSVWARWFCWMASRFKQHFWSLGHRGISS